MKWSWYGTQVCLLFCNNIVAESCCCCCYVFVGCLCAVRSLKAQNFDGIMNVYSVPVRDSLYESRRVCVWVRINIRKMWNGETYIFHLLKYTQEIRRNALISKHKTQQDIRSSSLHKNLAHLYGMYAKYIWVIRCRICLWRPSWRCCCCCWWYLCMHTF